MSVKKCIFAIIFQELNNQKTAIMLLSERLKELRLLSKLPQRKAAAELDVDTATYCKFEKGSLRIRREQLLKFAQYINADIDELLTLWLADQVKEIVSDDNKKIATDAMNIVYKNL